MMSSHNPSSRVSPHSTRGGQLVARRAYCPWTDLACALLLLFRGVGRVQIRYAPWADAMELSNRLLVGCVGEHRLSFANRKIAAGTKRLGRFRVEFLARGKVQSARKDRNVFISRVGVHLYFRIRRAL